MNYRKQLLLALLPVACAAQDTFAQSPDAVTGEALGLGQLPFETSTNELESNIIVALVTSLAIEAANVAVHAEPDGSVRLGGNVKTEVERGRAGRVATEVAGVTSVRNDLQTSYLRERSDSEIETDLELLLRQDQAFDAHAHALEVDVQDGVVELSGSVQSTAEKERAVEAAWAVGAMTVDVRALHVATHAGHPEHR
jgi:osmotically-inducible protein OsmY